MRKITAGLFVALDGVVEAPDQWHFPYFNDEMGAAVGGRHLAEERTGWPPGWSTRRRQLPRRDDFIVRYEPREQRGTALH
jgi:hypothetical protein